MPLTRSSDLHCNHAQRIVGHRMHRWITGLLFATVLCCDTAAQDLTKALDAIKEQIQRGDLDAAAAAAAKLGADTGSSEDLEAIAEVWCDLAVACYTSAQFPDALQASERALALRRVAHADVDHREISLTLIDVARCHMALGQYPAAQRAYEEALARSLRRTGNLDDADVAEHISDLGVCMSALGKLDESLKMQEEALSMRRRLHGEVAHQDIASSLCRVGLCLQDLARFDQALPLLRDSVAMYERLYDPTSSYCLTARYNLAACLQAAGRAGEALPMYEQILTADRAAHGDQPSTDVAMSLNNVADCLQTMGRAREALPLFQEALAMRQVLYPHETHPEIVASRNNLAACQWRLGEWSTALAGFESTLAAQLQAYGEKPHQGVIAAMINVAVSLQSLGRTDEALLRHEAAEQLALRTFGTTDHPMSAKCAADVADCLGELGRLADSLIKHEDALRSYRSAFDNQDNPGTASSLSQVAMARMRLGLAADALPDLEASLAMTRRLYPEGPNPDVATALHDLASCFLALGRPDEAIATAEEALLMRRTLYRGMPHPHVAQSLVQIAMLGIGAGKPADALEAAQEALQIYRGMFGDQHHPYTAACLVTVARALEACRRVPEALQALVAAAADVELLREQCRLSPAMRQSMFDELKHCGVFECLQRLLHVDSPEASFVVAERSRSRDLLDQLFSGSHDPIAQLVLRAQATGDRGRVDRLEHLRAELEVASSESDRILFELTSLTATTSGAPELRARREDLLGAADAAAVKLRRLRDERSREIGKLLPASRPAAPTEIQTALRSGELLLEFTLSPQAALLYVVPPTGRIAAYTLPGAQEAVAQAARAVQPKASGPSNRARGRDPDQAADGIAIDAAMHRLFRTLIPTEVWPQVLACKRVFVAGHREVHRVPLEMLVTSRDDGKTTYWLDDGPAIAYVPSGTLLHWLNGRRAPAAEIDMDLVAVGDPASTGLSITDRGPQPIAPAVSNDLATARRIHDLEEIRNLPPLPGAAAEVKAVVEAWTTRGGRAVGLLGAQATEARLFELAARARRLHFACHGVASRLAGEQLSMLVLHPAAEFREDDDGLLKLTDLFQRWSGRLTNCELVVLSACSTNVGDTFRDDAPNALPLGFLFAGARAVVASLWAVDDASTHLLMTDFHERLLDGKDDPLAALVAAKRRLRSRGVDPRHWSAFQFIGMPR